jgi:hypothetical protein
MVRVKVGVGDCVFVKVGVAVRVNVDVKVGDGDTVFVNVGVGVAVRV